MSVAVSLIGSRLAPPPNGAIGDFRDIEREL
jgi:hypothetical protein